MEAARLSLVCGLCALIPLPWVDEWAERNTRRKMYDALAKARGIELDAATLDTLVEDRSSLLVGCLFGVVRWPLKKLFRTFFYFLTIKDVIDGVAHAGLCAAMIDAALDRGALPARAAEVRAEVDLTLARFRWSPVSRLLTGGERPETAWIAAGDALASAVGWLYRHAGGKLVLSDFTARLEVPR
ncbi:MAG: hypothetical protein ACOZNI_02010 [Myxococcota bacterium]